MQESIKTLSQEDKEEFQEKAWQICMMYKEKWDERTQKKILDEVFELSEYSDRIPYLSKKLTYYDIWSFFHPEFGHSKSFKEMSKREFQKFIEENLLN